MPVRSAVKLLRCVVLAALVGAPALGLVPEQVAVVVNTASEGSRTVADHYLAARGIPKKNLLTVTLDPTGRGWSEQAYREKVVAPLRKQLQENELAATIRCLVVTYDMPLAIPPVVNTEAELAEIAGYKSKLAAITRELEKGQAAYEQLAPAPATSSAPATQTQPATTTATGPAPASAPATTPVDRTDPHEVFKFEQRLALAAEAAIQRIRRLPTPQRSVVLGRFFELHQQYFGPMGMVAIAGVSAESTNPQAARERLEKLQNEVRDRSGQIARILQQPLTTATRQQIVNLQAANGGVMGTAVTMSRFLADLQHVESSACLESELALLWENGYSRSRWVRNPVNLYVWPYVRPQKMPRVLIVARLDGLSPKAVTDMIDTTLQVEKQGLDGTFYIDARGLTGGDGYGTFDADLRKTADYLSQNSTMKIVLDNKPELLQAADCPDAALYCGWYSLRSYKDSCQWKPGAVGFHVASLEMPTLHRADETAWVTNLLRRGFCGTLGATEEPYLVAFPRPSAYFPLLLSGEFTQGEVYLVTNFTLSWRVGYVGDPLYNPCQAKPRLTPEKIRANPELRPVYEILAALNLGPGRGPRPAGSAPAPHNPPTSAPAR